MREWRPSRYLVLALLIWFAGGIGAFFLGEAYVEQQTRLHMNHTRQELQAAVVNAEQVALRAVEETQDLYALTLLRRELAARGNTEGAAAIESRLEALMRLGRFGIRQVSEIGADGILTWSTTRGWRPVDLSDREHFQVHRAGRRALFVSRPVLGRASGISTVQFTLPIIEADRFAGVVVVSLDPRLLSVALEQLRYESGIAVGIVRTADRTLIARSHDASRYIGLQPLTQASPVDRQRGRFGFMRTRSNLDDISAYFSYRIMEQAPLAIGARLSVSEATEPSGTLAMWIRIAILLGWLKLLATILWINQLVRTRRTRLGAAGARHMAQTESQAREQLQHLVADAPVALYAAQLEQGRRVLAYNFLTGNLQRLTGWSAEQLSEPGSIAARSDPVGQEARREFMARLAERGRAMVEYRLQRPDDSWIWLREEAQVTERDGGMLHIAGGLSDITAFVGDATP
ncbi:hypothetical protein EOD42_09490 [Rhodovarius crocodyli]|uniref:PAS fold-3 domain-containing protein n=1 Tax=Rhodovarius crocodyli TaxID=1979269 RepID=A0A437MGA5_9PROT|nr:hypothetical protein EOD42_09490 [Rhodovarius crocodyli]